MLFIQVIKFKVRDQGLDILKSGDSLLGYYNSCNCFISLKLYIQKVIILKIGI